MAVILVVDDEVRYTKNLKKILSLHGHDVSIANSSEDAIRLGLEIKPDILITDWMLQSDLDGGQVNAVLREANLSMKTLVITGHSDLEQRNGSLLEHIEEIIHKPFRIQTVLDFINKALSE